MLIDSIKHEEVHHTDVFIGDARIPKLLRSVWMPPLKQDVGHLTLPQHTQAASKDLYMGWPAKVCKASVHMDGSYNPETDQACWCFASILWDASGQGWFAGYMDGIVALKMSKVTF